MARDRPSPYGKRARLKFALIGLDMARDRPSPYGKQARLKAVDNTGHGEGQGFPQPYGKRAQLKAD